MQCRYKTQYDDWFYDAYSHTPSQKSFQCDQDAISSGYCIFHDPQFSYQPENQDEVRNKLTKRIKESIQNDKELECIGYNIPDFTINFFFRKKVYFNKTKFFGRLEVNAIFGDITSFQQCSFKGIVRFTGSQFYNYATFSNSEFKQGVFFNRTIFYDVTFDNVQFEVHIEFMVLFWDNIPGK
jgi:hypothetical protein